MKKFIFLEESLLACYFAFYSLIAFLFLRFSEFSQGWKLFYLTIFYHITFVAVAKIFRFYAPFRIWKFLLPLSVLMVFPDWFLSSVLKVLVFPEDGFFKIGTVSGYMAGLWSIPLFILVYTGIKLEERSVSIIGTCLWVGIFSLLIFGIAEAYSSSLGSWYAQNVKSFSGMAIYVLIPEIILGIVSYLAYQGFSGSPYIIQIGIGFLIMIQYLGNLSFFYLLIEKIL
ncbi:MAG: hypothetical protein SH817_16860 [Leptospira sp.]|nr:hypothetical protein [Leptospira sp.]